MKITIESTDKIVDLIGPGGSSQARVWEGTSESGIPVQCLVARVAVLASDDLTEFDAELQKCSEPRIVPPSAFPLRMIL